MYMATVFPMDIKHELCYDSYNHLNNSGSTDYCQRSQTYYYCTMSSSLKLLLVVLIFFCLENRRGSCTTIRVAETNNGLMITGDACGVLNTIKYLHEIPEDLANHRCSFIPASNLVGFDSTDSTYLFT